jgi:hypothetical protein
MQHVSVLDLPWFLIAWNAVPAFGRPTPASTEIALLGPEYNRLAA